MRGKMPRLRTKSMISVYVDEAWVLLRPMSIMLSGCYYTSYTLCRYTDFSDGRTGGDHWVSGVRPEDAALRGADSLLRMTEGVANFRDGLIDLNAVV